MAKTVKKTTKVVEKPKFEVSLTYNEKEVKLAGNTLEEVFLNYKPEPFKSTVVIRVASGGHKIERLWPVIKARRVFGNNNNAIIEGSLLEKLLA